MFNQMDIDVTHGILVRGLWRRIHSIIDEEHQH